MIETVTETGSTNTELLARLRAGEHVAEGDWLVADRQNAGRGRQGRAWFDGAGNFMGSTVVHPGGGDPPAPTLALLAGLATYEAVLPYCPDPAALRLKWPNDLMLGRAKLAGILLEAAGGAVVVGIGVNLVAAPQLPDRATVALVQIGPPPSRDGFARDLAAVFDREVERWRNFGLEPLLRRWQAAAYPPGTPITVNEPGEGMLSGRIEGLGPDGSLSLRLDDGSIRAIHAGDVMLA
ncbi:MAG: biotin--[acetyl-CoA-carboxylase] ligase [Sphingomonadales bacterium]|nr:biotin--[acetyl-CoA-carboxylase] ligase [Sphingomonadales bacterium]MBD3772230.1 biotin--[acetyl-CoA-carboxylase] ligase [Paracoccaceae bacterium]